MTQDKIKAAADALAGLTPEEREEALRTVSEGPSSPSTGRYLIVHPDAAAPSVMCFVDATAGAFFLPGNELVYNLQDVTPGSRFVAVPTYDSTEHEGCELRWVRPDAAPSEQVAAELDRLRAVAAEAEHVHSEMVTILAFDNPPDNLAELKTLREVWDAFEATESKPSAKLCAYECCDAAAAWSAFGQSFCAFHAADAALTALSEGERSDVIGLHAPTLQSWATDIAHTVTKSGEAKVTIGGSPDLRERLGFAEKTEVKSVGRDAADELLSLLESRLGRLRHEYERAKAEGRVGALEHARARECEGVIKVVKGWSASLQKAASEDDVRALLAAIIEGNYSGPLTPAVIQDAASLSKRRRKIVSALYSLKSLLC